MTVKDMLEEGRQVFAEESRDLLRQMENALLLLEAAPGDVEAINSLFRAAHTIKGSAGLFAYDAIVRFTHVVESVLDRVRNNEVALDADLMTILLPCCDHMGALVEQVGGADVDESALAAAGGVLQAKLEVYLGGSAPHGAQAVPVPAAPEADGVAQTAACVETDAWHISLRFGRDVLRNGMDPLSFIRYLGTLGEVAGIVTIDDALPTGEDFDPESCYLGFEIRLLSAADKKTIEDVFEFVRADCTINILPPHSRADAFVKLIEDLHEDSVRLGEILVACGALTQNELAAALAAQSNAGEPLRLGDLLVEGQTVQREVVEAALNKQQKVQTQKAEESRFIRVSADKLDQLITLVGELVIAGAGTHTLAQRGVDTALRESTSNLNRLTEEIRESALRLRMVQIGETFSRFHRVVRDLSRSLGKEITLDIDGAETELDKTVVEKIGDPLTHLVRNAMDHGIESAEERTQAGKAARGRIALNAYHDSGCIVIEVRDDGKGLARDRILAKARERGLIGAEQTPSEQEIFNLVFEPGFSTAEQITDLSGRGVGMDVVRRNIEALRGQVSLASRVGVGTTVTIRLPLTLAIIDGFLVQAGDSVYVLPLDFVVECVELPAHNASDGNYFSLRGQLLPYLRLREFLDLAGAASARESVVIVRFGDRKAGIVVDRLIGEAQTVIKPLGALFSRLQGISGSTILGTGEVALIIDVPGLLQQARVRAGEHDRLLAAA